MPTIKQLAEELGTDVETLRQSSNVGPNVQDDANLTPAEEQNLRGTWSQSQVPTPSPAPGTTGGKVG